MATRVVGTISFMWWSIFFVRLSAVHSLITTKPLVVSHSFGFIRNTRREYFGLRQHVPSLLSRLQMAEAAVVAMEKNTTTTGEVLSNKVNLKGTVILADADDFVKPDRDPRDYRIIKLKNNLQALLVSTAAAISEDDDSANVEAASMHIQAGHFDDTLPGLAHFYEHMLVCGGLRAVFY